MIKYNQTDIKESITQKAMEIWGIEDKRYIDPVVNLLLDVFSYELSRVNSNIKVSDAKLLERLSQILVPQKNHLPNPAHALVRAFPREDYFTTTRSNIFLMECPKNKNHLLKEIAFTPLVPHKLINANVYCTASHNQLTAHDEYGTKVLEIEAFNQQKMPDYTMWVGIDISDTMLSNTTHLELGLVLKDSIYDAFLPMVRAYDDTAQNELSINLAEKKENVFDEHFFETVVRYYQQYFYTLNLPKANRKKHATEVLGSYFKHEELQEIKNKLFWFKLEFPVVFSKIELSKLQVVLNTFPVVNRKFYNKFQYVDKNGRILFLGTGQNYFLNVEKVIDDSGSSYKKAVGTGLENLKGSYTVYSGDLKSFDERNAKNMIEEFIQTVREEGSSFVALGYEGLNMQLEQINSNLTQMEEKTGTDYKHVDGRKRNYYLMTVPFDNTSFVECSYWATNAEHANNLPENSTLNTKENGNILAQSARLITDTVGGNSKGSVREQVESLRFGLIAKERIISKEDISAFVYAFLGKIVENVTVKSGVGISYRRKEGLIRTTDVVIRLSKDTMLNSENKKRLSSSVIAELSDKSVHNIPYKVIIE